MRSNIFLHFLNRDSREIYGLYQDQPQHRHYQALLRATNAAVLLCEEYCVIPPGFVVECDIAFSLLEKQNAYLRDRLIRLPIREVGLGEFADKKRQEYAPMRDRYSGLFDDERLAFLSDNAEGLIPRRVAIGETIATGWMQAADSRSRIWAPVKGLLPASVIDVVRRIPDQLIEDGIATTWAAIEAKLPDEARRASEPLRNSLQNIYFRAYMAEFGLVVLRNSPLMLNDFALRTNPRIYDYERLYRYLRSFQLEYLLDGDADALSILKRQSGTIAFLDAYSELAKRSETLADIEFASGEAARRSRFDWGKFRARQMLHAQQPSGLDVAELSDALREVAEILRRLNDLPVRGSERAPKGRPLAPLIVRGHLPEIIFFVALKEELDVLSKHLKLTRNALSPAAHGRVGSQEVAVLCPNAMGRTAAAVETAIYLQRRAPRKPELLIILGLAGGFKKSGTMVGHILIGRTVVDLATRKVSDQEEGRVSTEFRREDFPLDPALGRLLTSDRFDRDAWQKRAIDEADWPEDRRPSLHEGLIASTDEVISSDTWSEKLLTATPKLKGIEMEAGGVCLAARPFGVRVSMLRTVSDTADPAKADDEWRRRGMKTLALLIQQLPFDDLREALKAQEQLPNLGE